MMVGVGAYGLPGEFRAVLVGLPVGVCVTAFTIGIRRWRAREKKTEPEPEPERRPLWRRVAVTLAWAVPLGVALGLILGSRGSDLVGGVAVLMFAALFQAIVMPRVERWYHRHGL
jgi:hypothetical protein